MPVRRRTLHILTLFFAIMAVPFVSWAVLNSRAEVPQMERMEYAAGAGVFIGLAFMGWWTIQRNHIVLYYEEARFIWPGAVLLVLLTTGLGWTVADRFFQRGRLDYIVPLSFGGMMLLFLLVRWAQLSRQPKKSEIVRGGPSRGRSRRSLPVANVLMEELAKAKKLHGNPASDAREHAAELNDASGEAPPPEDLED